MPPCATEVRDDCSSGEMAWTSSLKVTSRLSEVTGVESPRFQLRADDADGVEDKCELSREEDVATFPKRDDAGIFLLGGDAGTERRDIFAGDGPSS